MSRRPAMRRIASSPTPSVQAVATQRKAIPRMTSRPFLPLATSVIGAHGVRCSGCGQTYAADYSKVQDWLVGFTGGGYSATRDPRLFAITAASIGALLLLDYRAAFWLAVPALWPASQYFYATFAMPLRSPWLAFVLAAAGTPNASLVPWTIVASAGCRVVGRLVGGLGRLQPVIPDGNAPPAATQRTRAD